MSLTSYQAAPPRVFIYVYEDGESKPKKLAPAVGFEPTTNRLTADRSTTELRWIIVLAQILAQSGYPADRSREKKISPGQTYTSENILDPLGHRVSGFAN
jgi:hypothetical protein